jgi:hypothetical protein
LVAAKSNVRLFGPFETERFNAVGTNAGAVSEFDRHLREQGVWYVQFGAPARPFPSRSGAKLAFVRGAAKRTLSGIK